MYPRIALLCLILICLSACTKYVPVNCCPVVVGGYAEPKTTAEYVENAVIYKKAYVFGRAERPHHRGGKMNIIYAAFGGWVAPVSADTPLYSYLCDKSAEIGVGDFVVVKAINRGVERMQVVRVVGVQDADLYSGNYPIDKMAHVTALLDYVGDDGECI